MFVERKKDLQPKWIQKLVLNESFKSAHQQHFGNQTTPAKCKTTRLRLFIQQVTWALQGKCTEPKLNPNNMSCCPLDECFSPQREKVIISREQKITAVLRPAETTQAELDGKPHAWPFKR